MLDEYSGWQKAGFYLRAIALYGLTIGFIVFAAQPAARQQHQVLASSSGLRPYVSTAAHISVIAGVPNRIVIPNSNVDLPIDPGYYDPTTGDWTLSGYHAQYALVSALANNYRGETFIYGHNNNYVFGALRHVTPSVNDPALLYTDNGHIFQYTFVSANSVAPDDTTSLSYQGPSVLTIQTCTGSLNEWRTMYHFSFVKVVQ